MAVDTAEVFEWSILGAFIAIIVGLLFAVIMAAFSDGKADYCYMTQEGPNQSALMAHRPWNPDTTIATISTVEEAVNTAKIYGCELK